jgi:NADH:ubiquinone oxidoreductase subunit F (NADH-binding)
MSFNLSELLGRRGIDRNLFEDLGRESIADGTLDAETLSKLADDFLVGTANTFGTSSFYDFLKPENRGKQVYVCNGTACECAGTQVQLSAALRQHFGADEIGHMTCLGRCHENSAFHYRGNTYSGSAFSNLDDLLDSTEKSVADTYSVGYYGAQFLTRPFPGLQAFVELLKSLLRIDSADLLTAIQQSGLRGRGGAGFPMGDKLEFCYKAPGAIKFVICNADEGDPGAYSDRYLLEQQPFAVLFGMLICGRITGAQYGILYIRAEYPEAKTSVEKAIQELINHGCCGSAILGSSFDFQFKIIQAQGSYICGEETALINSIEGQRPEVRTRPPYPAQQGLFNKPTVVQNVETLAALYPIMELGWKAWRRVGTAVASGTKLVSLDGFFNRPGIYEVAMGTPLSVVIYELGGGFKHPVKALQIGGPLGGVVPIHKVDELYLDFESFKAAGFLLGHASVVSIPEEYPMIQYLEHLLAFASYESCGKCFPCRLGTQRGKELIQRALNQNYHIDRELFADLLVTLEKGSLCAHGGGIPLPIRNILLYFESELTTYFKPEAS